MSQSVILLVDNRAGYLATTKQLIEQEGGYIVLTATNPSDARKFISQEKLDLAILDIRLEDEMAESDISGLSLAKEMKGAIPIIMLTAFPTLETATEALKPSLEGIHTAVDFVSKREGWPALRDAIKVALIKRDVFIVHGHDQEMLLAVKDLIKTLKLKPVILKDMLGHGDTIVEMIEKYGDVAYAVVLMTPDDFGGSHKEPDITRDRARQNVVLELGFFMGKLGRSRVIALIKGGIEKPSDYYGVRYISIDSGDGWKLQLAKELNGAGFYVDFDVFKMP